MYKIVALETVGIRDAKRFLGEADKCRFCGTSNPSDFGNKTNAHTFPEGLGNKSLFSLNECCSCNSKFSQYEDALCKAIGPYLTLGGVKGKKGVRQTGRSRSVSVLRHDTIDGKRHILIKADKSNDLSALTVGNNQTMNFHLPVKGDKFVPRYAYKALLKIALSILPINDLCLFRCNLECLQSIDEVPGTYPLNVGFSYASIGNAPPTLAGAILQRTNDNIPVPYIIAIFQAGSVCFQISLRSEVKDKCVPLIGKFGISWTSNLAKPEGGYHPIKYSEPIQFNWSELKPQLQSVEAFEFSFNTKTTEGEFKPIMRDLDQ